jgi:uncharacterized protein YjgD (DUF1641 family)
MKEDNIQQQINEINQKLDLVLEHINQQRLKSETIDDLISDVSIIGKDVYDSTVSDLEEHAVEIDPAEVKVFLIKLLKNVNNFSQLLGFFESMSDLLKDVQPIANEMIIDMTRKMNELEQKGYFEFLRESARIIDNIVSHFSAEDVGLLADNMVGILETVKNLTQPDVMSAMNNAITIFKSMDVNDIPEYSIFKAMREMRTPEMKKGIGFMVVFLKNLSKANIAPG